MDNAVDSGACYRMARALGEIYIARRGIHGEPTKVLLDFDATDDPTHGDQEESYYHGYFEQHMYHPLLVFDGDSGQLVSATLRAGTAHALIHRGIVLDTVNPGPTENGAYTEETIEAGLPHMPQGRWGQPEDVARLVGWLCTDDAGWVVGQIINSEGGFRM